VEKLIQLIAVLSRKIGLTEEESKEQFNFTELTLTQLLYLETINELGNPNITELSLRLKLSKPTVTVIVDRLVAKDFVVRVYSDQDRRSRHLHLTEKGKLINVMHDYAHRRMAESFTNSLTDSELNILIGLLDKVVKGM
jgi:DNA-binding MarR family transcriptional regulator